MWYRDPIDALLGQKEKRKSTWGNLVCSKCGLSAYIEPSRPYVVFRAPYGECPVCAALEKEPTPKLTAEEVEWKKGEMRKRIIENSDMKVDG